MKKKSSHKNRQRKQRPKIAQNQHRSTNKSVPSKKNPISNKSEDNKSRNTAQTNEKTRGFVSKQKSKPKEISKQEKIRREHVKSSKVLPAFVFLMMAIYLFGQLVIMTAARSSIGLETVILGTLDSLEEHQGIIVREEYVALATEGGHVEYAFTEGDLVPKNSVVAIIQDEVTVNSIEEKLNQIDLDILKSQKNRTDISLFAEDIARIDQTIQQTITQNINRFMGESMESVYDVKARVQASMNQRNEIWFTEDIDSVSQLTTQKFQYESELAENTSIITAEESGILSFSCDGLEESLNFASLDSITEAQIGNVSTSRIDTDQIVEEGQEVFKIVTNNQWYIVTYLPNTTVINWTEGQNREITLKNGTDKVAISGTIRSIVNGESKSKVVFSTYRHIDLFMNDRSVTLYPEINITEGLKIPKSAMIEKTLLAIPKGYLTQNGKDYGVTVRSENGSERFVVISVSTSDDKYNYLSPNEYLQTGDIIVNTTDSYELTNLVPVPGVYSANSSVAKFTFVEILEQNTEYAIVRNGNNYGLQPYDVIISDAKNIMEGQQLY